MPIPQVGSNLVYDVSDVPEPLGVPLQGFNVLLGGNVSAESMMAMESWNAMKVSWAGCVSIPSARSSIRLAIVGGTGYCAISLSRSPVHSRLSSLSLWKFKAWTSTVLVCSLSRVKGLTSAESGVLPFSPPLGGQSRHLRPSSSESLLLGSTPVPGEAGRGSGGTGDESLVSMVSPTAPSFDPLPMPPVIVTSFCISSKGFPSGTVRWSGAVWIVTFMFSVKMALRHWLTVMFVENSRSRDRCDVASCLTDLCGQSEHVSVVCAAP